MDSQEGLYERHALSGPVRVQGFLGFLFYRFQRFNLRRCDAVKKLLPEHIGHLLDVGCGKGDFLFSIQNKVQYGLGLDIAAYNIEQANQVKKQTNAHNLEFSCSAIEDFKNGIQFDCITSIALLAFIFDPFFVFKKFNQWLKKDGFLIVQVPNMACITNRLSLLFGVFPRTSWNEGWDGGHINYFTFHSLIHRLFIPSGFEIVRLHNSGIFARLRGLYRSLLAPDIIVMARKVRDIE